MGLKIEEDNRYTNPGPIHVIVDGEVKGWIVRMQNGKWGYMKFTANKPEIRMVDYNTVVGYLETKYGKDE